MSSETLSPICYFDRILPVPEDSFLVSFVGSGSWSSSRAGTPASTHTSIWPFSHSEVQSGGTNLSCLCEEFNTIFSTSLFTVKLWVRQKKNNSLGVGGISTATILPQPHPREQGCWSTTENKRGLKTEQSSLALAAPAALQSPGM